MFLAMSAETLLTADFGAGAPILAAPSWAPSQEYWLKFLSSSVPTSVTNPIFRADAAADPAGVPPPPHAATMMARPLNSVRPSERLCMCPPPGSRAVRPVIRQVRDGLEERSLRGA